MGADLYIKKLPRKAQYRGFEVSDDARKAGYFRDCYNEGGLLAVISANTTNNLSWWKTADRKELFSKEHGDMTVTGAKQWLSELKPIIEEFNKLPKLNYLEYNPKTMKRDIIKPIEESEVQEYRKWANGLIEFLELAISLKSQIIWSV